MDATTYAAVLRPIATPWLMGGGEMGEYLREWNWAATALGPLEEWPASLRLSVSTCLASPFPILIVWGEQRVMLYNDAFRRLVGHRHPDLLGRHVREYWGLAWSVMCEHYDAAFARQSVLLDEQPVCLERDGHLREVFVSGALSAVQDETGRVVGVVSPMMESTLHVLKERRMQALRDVALSLLKARTLQEIFTLTAHTLQPFAHDLPFTLFYLQGGQGRPPWFVSGTGLEPGTRASPLLLTRGEGGAHGWPIEEVWRTRQPVLVDDLEQRFGVLHAGPYPEPLQQALALPLLLPGEQEPVGLLLAGVSSRLVLDASYLEFYQLLVSTLTTALLMQWDPSRRREGLEEAAETGHILLADGNAGMRDHVRHILTAQGWSVEAVDDGEQALVAARARPPDLILADLTMPKLDGLELLRQLRADPLTQDVSVILHSGQAGETARRASLALGADDFLEDPFSSRELVVRVQSQLALGQVRHPTDLPREQFYQLMQRSPASIAVLKGPDHVLEFVNTHHHVFTHRHSVLGRPARQVFPELAGQGFFELLDRAYQSGESFKSQEMAIQLERAEHGHAEEFFINLTCQPLRGPDGRVEGVVASHIDVTDRVRSRRREEQRAAELEAVIQSIPDGICIADTSGHIRTNRIDPAILRSGGIGDALQRALNGESSTREVYLMSDLGKHRVIRSATAPVRLRENIVGAVSINVDITERKRAEAEREVLLASEQSARSEAERANQKKDEFLARVSHELATPLVGMRLWIELLESNSDRRAEALSALAKCLQSQTKIVHDLLDTARALSGKLSVVLEACEPSEPLEAAINDLRPLAQSKGIRLEVRLQETPLVQADPKRMRQVVSNLLSNALKFTPPGGLVEVRLEPEREGVSIVVRDTGRGFPAEFQPQLFAPFHQEEEGTTRTHGGLGLGLSIVRQLMELQGGTVWAHSPGRGQGATFIVWLPALEELAEDPSDAPPPEFQPRLEGVRLLLVEDDALTRVAMAALLEQNGARVEAVDGAAPALAALEERPFDVLVSDIAMPGEDGYSLIRKVRASKGSNARVPAAAFTAHMREVDRLQALQAGFQLHIPKSMETEELLMQLLKLVGTPH